MTEYQSLMLQSLRDEIAFFNAQIQLMVLTVTVVCVAAFMLAHHPTFRRVALVIPFAIASGLFAIGRADLLMHRAGAFVREIESTLPASMTWEVFKSSRPSTSLLPLYDLAGLTLWTFLLVWAERDACRQLPLGRRLPFLAGTLALVAAGGASIVYGALQR